MAYDRVRQRVTDLGTAQVYWDTLRGTPQHGMVRPAGYPGYGTRSLGSITETTEDTVSDNYRARINRGEIINHFFRRGKVTEIHSAPGAYRHYYRSTIGTTCSNGHPAQTEYQHEDNSGVMRLLPIAYKPLGSSLTGLLSSVKAEAVTQAHANIDVSEMLALATVAESGKSVQSMMSIYSRLKKVLKKARRLDIAGLSKELTLKELSNRWMEVRYAIRPLVYDAYGIAKSLEKNRGYERRTYRGSASGSATESDVLAKQLVLYGTACDWTRTNTLEISCRAGVLCDVSIDDLTVFGVDQALETLWELAPMSFVVDWFVGVGDWIAAQTPNFGVTQRASWVTSKYKVTQTQSSGPTYPNIGTAKMVFIDLSVPLFHSEWTEDVLLREVDPQVSTFPIVDVKLDVFKLTDMGIMLKNFLR